MHLQRRELGLCTDAFQEFLRQVMARTGGDERIYLNLQTDKDRMLEPPLLQLLGDFSIPAYFKDLTAALHQPVDGQQRQDHHHAAAP